MNTDSLELLSVSGNPDLAEILVAQIEACDNARLEFVDAIQPGLCRSEKWIINISTQYGCPVRCCFCDAGGEYRGNVPASVMLAQVRTVLDRHPDRLRTDCRKLKVHFSRMGEPSLNPEVLEALSDLTLVIPNPNLWACVATVFPKGRMDWFRRLLEIKKRKYHGRFQLQLSINSTDERVRNRMIPIPLASFDEMAEFGREFHDEFDRKPILNFALMKGVPLDPNSLPRRFDPKVFAVKLTPLNPTFRGADEGLDSEVSRYDLSRAHELVRALTDEGYETVMSIGSWEENNLGSNCGQAIRAMAPISSQYPRLDPKIAVPTLTCVEPS